MKNWIDLHFCVSKLLADGVGGALHIQTNEMIATKREL